MSEEKQEWLTTQQVADELRINEKTVRNWIHKEGLIALNIGKGYRIARKDLNTFIQSKQTRHKPSTQLPE